MFLGCRDDVPEYYIGAKYGLGRSSDIRRLPPSSRYDSEMLLALRGMPFEPTHGENVVGVPLRPGSVVVDMPDVAMIPPDPPDR